MINFAIPYARYTSLVGATGMAKFRTISGLPARRHLYPTALFIICLDFRQYLIQMQLQQYINEPLSNLVIT